MFVYHFFYLVLFCFVLLFLTFHHLHVVSQSNGEKNPCHLVSFLALFLFFVTIFHLVVIFHYQNFLFFFIFKMHYMHLSICLYFFFSWLYHHIIWIYSFHFISWIRLLGIHMVFFLSFFLDIFETNGKKTFYITDRWWYSLTHLFAYHRIK